MLIIKLKVVCDPIDDVDLKLTSKSPGKNERRHGGCYTIGRKDQAEKIEEEN